MKIYRISKLLLTALLFSTIALTSCKKEENPPEVATTKSGNIKASVSYTPQTIGSSVHYLKGNMKIELLKNDKAIATQFSSSNVANIDFGQYEYGTYVVRLTFDVWSADANNGYNNALGSINEKQTITLDALTKTATFTIKL